MEYASSASISIGGAHRKQRARLPDGFTVGQWLLNLLALVQFLWLLFARAPNEFLARFGSSLAIWLADVGRFLTCATDDKPFPWSSRPGTAVDLPAQ